MHSQVPDLSAYTYVQDIEKALEPVLYMYKQRRRPGEALGDFTARIGFETLRQYAQVTFFAAPPSGCVPPQCIQAPCLRAARAGPKIQA